MVEEKIKGFLHHKKNAFWCNEDEYIEEQKNTMMQWKRIDRGTKECKDAMKKYRQEQKQMKKNAVTFFREVWVYNEIRMYE